MSKLSEATSGLVAARAFILQAAHPGACCWFTAIGSLSLESKPSLPQAGDGQVVHDVIYNELCHGVTRHESRAALRNIIAGLAGEGGGVVDPRSYGDRTSDLGV